MLDGVLTFPFVLEIAPGRETGKEDQVGRKARDGDSGAIFEYIIWEEDWGILGRMYLFLEKTFMDKNSDFKEESQCRLGLKNREGWCGVLRKSLR